MWKPRMRPLLATAVAISLTTVVLAGTALAAAQDYRFEAVQPTVRAGNATTVTVRLVHVPSGKPVPDAVVIGSKLEMPMAGMSPMAARVAPVKPDGHGNYSFQTDLAMEGEWVLALAAKVNGEHDTVRGTVKVSATK